MIDKSGVVEHAATDLISLRRHHVPLFLFYAFELTFGQVTSPMSYYACSLVFVFYVYNLSQIQNISSIFMLILLPKFSLTIVYVRFQVAYF